jgi:hypothetical protein
MDGAELLAGKRPGVRRAAQRNADQLAAEFVHRQGLGLILILRLRHRAGHDADDSYDQDGDPDQRRGDHA